jgi:hypothetical protein
MTGLGSKKNGDLSTTISWHFVGYLWWGSFSRWKLQVWLSLVSVWKPIVTKIWNCWYTPLLSRSYWWNHHKKLYPHDYVGNPVDSWLGEWLDEFGYFVDINIHTHTFNKIDYIYINMYRTTYIWEATLSRTRQLQSCKPLIYPVGFKRIDAWYLAGVWRWFSNWPIELFVFSIKPHTKLEFVSHFGVSGVSPKSYRLLPCNN